MVLPVFLESTHWIVATIDFLLVYFLVYRLLVWISESHAESLVRGLLVVFALYAVSFTLKLTTLNWLLGKFATVLMLLLLIVFQPELRRFLERVGSGRLLTPLMIHDEDQNVSVIKQILRAVDILSKERVGGLIVIELGSNLNEYIQSGIRIQSHISGELLASLFWPKSPTHDGAVIIRESRVAAAGCLLPLTEATLQDRRLGTRHRAAMGLSEVSDALVIVISEETGVISLAERGNLTRYLNKQALETRLFSLYKEEVAVATGVLGRMNKWFQQNRWKKGPS